MPDQTDDIPQLRQENAYYKRQLDELAGENLKLDYMISGLRHELKQKRQGFSLLSELQQSIGSHKQISSIFEATAAAINSTLGMDRTVVLMPTERDGCFRPTHWLGFRPDGAARLSSLLLELTAGTDAEITVVVNAATPPTPLIERIRAAFELKYFICVPVAGEAAPIALLVSGRLKEARPLYPPLDRGDLDTFQSIAGLISALIRNMRVAVLEETDRLKTEFFANISHEFRTPLTLTLGPLEQLLAGRYGGLSPAVRNELQMMRRNQERLLGLVNQILDLAKLEAQGMQLRAAPIADINRFIEERLATFRPMAERRGLELTLSLDPRARLADVYIDQEKFDRVLLNLLSNALKFTPHGSIEVATDIRDGAFRLTVSDTGIGVREDQLPFIFDRFRQADGSSSRDYAGTGIGLALVKEIVRLHGGEIAAYSQYGKGTSFRVSLPLGRSHLPPGWAVDAPEEEITAYPAPEAAVLAEEGATDREGVEAPNREAESAFDASQPTIVYAEDNPDLRRYVLKILAQSYNVFLAVDGRDGLEKIRHYRPDLVLSDEMMPGLSGRDLLRVLRNDPELSSTPVVFLTARAGTEARIESLEAGADDYLAKPFHEDELLARIRNLLRARAQERALAELNQRLEARVEEQMAQLVRSGELRRFLPAPVVDQLLSGELQTAPRFERRKITALFVDMVGFTDLADQLEPEDLSTLLNEFLQEMTAVSVEHGGTVDKLTGDGMMVVYGAPQPLDLPDQALSAVRTALAMRRRTRELAVRWRRRGVPGDPDVRVGINTGYCTVGIFGNDLLRSYTAVGTPINIAARLEEEAPAGGILCGFPTFALVEHRVRAERRGQLTLRGVARPVEAHQILELREESLEASGRDQSTEYSATTSHP